MNTSTILGLWPAAASVQAQNVDWLVCAFTLVLLALTVPIFLFMTYCAAKYHAGSDVDRSHTLSRNVGLELSWMLIPFFVTLVFFAWAARIYDVERHPPPNALTITAMGRQWMWKFQHPGGQAEINDLHVPMDEPVRINLISQDVVHALYIPALRMQMDAIPGHETELWFDADRPGTYQLYCSEYCGADHSEMRGILTVMRQGDYQRWLASQGSGGTLVADGHALFASYGCSGCHGAGSAVHAPDLAGLFMRPVPMENGGTVVADNAYIMDKILYPNRNLVAGYKQLMPSFAGRMPGGDLFAIADYIRSLQPGQTP